MPTMMEEIQSEVIAKLSDVISKKANNHTNAVTELSIQLRIFLKKCLSDKYLIILNQQNKYMSAVSKREINNSIFNPLQPNVYEQIRQPTRISCVMQKQQQYLVVRSLIKKQSFYIMSYKFIELYSKYFYQYQEAEKKSIVQQRNIISRIKPNLTYTAYIFYLKRIILFVRNTIYIYHFLFMQSKQLASRDINSAQNTMIGSCPTVPYQSNKNPFQSDSENNKTTTKLPPLFKLKSQQAIDNLNINQKRQMSIMDEQKKLSSNTQQVVRAKRKANTKKEKGPIFKPQTIEKYNQYREFLNLVNITNNLKITNSEKFNNYVLYVGKGNNSTLIKSLFKTNRPWWTIQENDPDNPKINLFWFQLKQNQILDNFKEVRGFNGEPQLYYMEEQQKIQLNNERSSSKLVEKRTSTTPTKNQNRSQSVIQKDNRLLARITLNKRNSSKPKITSNSSEKISPGKSQRQFGKELKEQVQIDLSATVKGRKNLANPKMWPIYHNYRKIFSSSSMKQLKNLKIIQQDSKINSGLTRQGLRIIQSRSQYLRMHNHCENNWNLSNKKALFINMKNYYENRKINPFQYIPMTFHVQEIGDKQYERFLEIFQKRNENITQQEQKNKKGNSHLNKGGFKPKKRNAWLVKPGQNTNRGTGIEVVETLQQIKEIINKQKIDSQGRTRTHIIQQYILPFLYQKRKFDIRSYICVTSINGYFKGYWYQDGYIRTACKQFNMRNLTNKYIHLTNDAVQKKCQDYGKFQNGNKLSFSDFQRYLDSTVNLGEGTKLKFWSQVYPQMKKLATDAMRAVYTKIDPNKKEFSFEIFGLDFLIDESFKVWLIEANTNPCLQLSSPLLARLIPSMLQNAMKLVVDPIFVPPNLSEYPTNCKKIPQNILENNKFQLVFDEEQQGKQLRAVINDTPQVQIYNIQEQQQQYEDEQNAKEPKYEQCQFEQ